MKTNSLIYKTSKQIVYDGIQSTIYVKITLNDECKNGHQDFAITGDIYKGTNGNKSDSNFLTGGCIHEEIAKYFPKFKMFINLHLCDFNGCPMYAVANGFYHLTEGMNNTKITDPNFKTEYCKYYRINSNQFDIISKSENKIEFALLLIGLGIIEQWKEEAQTAIKELELMTGDEFINDSIKNHFDCPELAQIEEFKKKKKQGYYSEENKSIRAKKTAKDSLIKILTELKNDYTNKQSALTLEYNLKRIFAKCLIPTFNWIHYTHNNKLVFNWNKSPYYKEITKETALKAVKKANKLLKDNKIICYFDGIALNDIN